jgi:outer membrane protein OmpA-like peptidoglycan-associated protein
MKGCNNKEEAAVVPAADTVAMVKPEAVAPVVKVESIKVSLPGGVMLDANKGGIEDQLVTFLNDPNAAAGKEVWFDFNDLNFEFGTANIVPTSVQELVNIQAILKAFPKAKIKIGGYTDKVGNEEANKKLSQQRADAVMNYLKKNGDVAQITGAEGYGSQFAKYPAEAPEEDRIKDRRVSVSVREK